MVSPHRTRRVVVPLVAVVVPGLLALDPATAAADPSPTPAPAVTAADPRVEPAPSLAEPLRGRAALRALGDRLDDAARVNDLSTAELRELLTDDPTVWVSTSARLYYVDPAPTDVPDAAPVARGPYPYSQTFLLHSKPGSQRTIFLDVDGATVSGTEWGNPDFGGLPDGSHPAWDPAGNGASFSNAEQDLVQSVWQQVAEDYAPFDVDVTTQDPGQAAITRAGAGDEQFGTRALITPSTTAWEAICESGCGGVAFIDVFDDPFSHADLQPAWVFPQALGPNNAKFVAEAVSHEVGHNMGLNHDGKDAVSYYSGHGPWAPIMGDSYDRPISQWSAGSYTGATQPLQDDVAQIASSTHASRADEAVGTIADAPELPPSGTQGYVTTRLDVDVFDLGTCSGAVTLNATAAPTSPNLDIRLRVLDAVGTAVATVDPASAAVDYDTASGMSASYSSTLASGRYYAEIDGVGNGTVNTGYDDYGSLGAYTLTQTGCSVAPPGTPSAPQTVTATPQANGRSVLVSWSAPSSPGSTAVTGYTVSRIGAGAVTTSDTSTLVEGLDPGTAYTFTVRAVNDGGSGLPATASATTFSPPGAPTSVAGTQDVGAGTATVTWDLPGTTGGTPVLGFEVAVDGGGWATKDLADRSHTFTGLTGTTHTLAVRAVNGVGAGSAAQAVVSAATAPSAVTNLRYSLAGTTALVEWNPPASTGGSPITGYEVELLGDVTTFTTPGVTVGPLTRGVSYTVVVRAVNAIGAGPERSVTFRAPTTSTAPRIGAAGSGARGGAVTAVARWSPPTSTGGAAISAYQVYAYQLNRSGRVVRTFSTSAVGAALRRAEVRVPAGRYRFAVRARNAVGWSKLSAKSGIVTAR